MQARIFAQRMLNVLCLQRSVLAPMVTAKKTTDAKREVSITIKKIINSLSDRHFVGSKIKATFLFAFLLQCSGKAVKVTTTNKQF